MISLPPETWTPWPRDQIVDLPYFARDDWGRDKVDARLVGCHETDWTGVPIELPYRVRYDGEVYLLMHADPDEPVYWKEA